MKIDPALVLTICLGVPLLTQTTAPQTPVFRGGVDLIAVDVHVVDRDGHPIAGLGVDDFKVWVNGHERRVVSADLVAQALAGARSPEAQSSLATATPSPSPIETGPRRFLIVVDEASISTESLKPVLSAANAFINSLAPPDLLGAYGYPLGEAVARLTTNRDVVKRMLTQMIGHASSPPGQYEMSPSEVVDLNAGDADVFRRVIARECPPGDTTCPESIKAQARAFAGYYEAQAAQSINSLRGVFRGLGTLPGRKTVLLLTGGMLSSDRMSGRPDIAMLMLSIGQEAAAANVNLYVFHVDSSVLDAQSASRRASMNPTDRIISAQRDGNSLATGLERLSAEAGGEFFRISAGAGEFAFERVLRESSAWYLLGVEPIADDRDGHTHFIRVAVSAKGADVRFRKEVVIPKPGKTTG